ncbi:MAG: 50S ribosomal protein L13 [Patescibacteria group bacterium]
MTWKKIKGMPTVKRNVHEIDATGQVVGRLATKIATLLIGKHKTDYLPHVDMGDFVTVKNAAKVVFTGKKWDQKVHYRSTNRPSGVHSTPVSKLRQENPGEILRHAVKYMLPKNKLQDYRLKRLKIS